jgi:alkanesulfonate monooxygenase SsuD/methylene tetrahydromethanopterin reductase-like flavin-dependent oxidoreductase (luciferase family)
VRIGVGLPSTVPGADGGAVAAWSRGAEERGFASLATTEHVAFPGLDPLTPLAAAAAVTERIELQTSVVILPLRNPVLLAKETAAIDVMSGGRLTVGMAVGWRDNDFAATGQPLAGRGRRFEAGIETMRSVWSGEPPAASAAACPPLARGTIPILIGGTAERSAPRVARFAEGWHAGGVPTSVIGDGIAVVRRAWAEAGRDGRPRVLAVRYVALGHDARASFAAQIDAYYDEASPELRQMFKESVLDSPAALRRELDLATEAGLDDVVLLPFSASLDELDRLATAALG